MDENKVKELYVVYDVAYRENKPELLKDHLNSFAECKWMYENSVGKYKKFAMKRACDYVNTFDECVWVSKQAYLVDKEGILKKIKQTKNEIEMMRKNR